MIEKELLKRLELEISSAEVIRHLTIQSAALVTI